MTREAEGGREWEYRRRVKSAAELLPLLAYVQVESSASIEFLKLLELFVVGDLGELAFVSLGLHDYVLLGLLLLVEDLGIEFYDMAQ